MDFEQVLSHDSVLLESEGRHCRKKEALRCSEINISIFLSTEELNEVANQNTCVCVYAYTLETGSMDCSKRGLMQNID